MTQRIDCRFPDNSEQLFKENLGLVYHLLNELIPNEGTDIDTISVEDAAMRAYTNAIRLFTSDHGAKFSTYAYTAIRNGIVGELDRQNRERMMIGKEKIHLESMYTIVRRPTEDSAFKRIFWELFQRSGLTEMEVNVMILHELHGMTFEEIARVYSNSRQANFNALSRAKEKLANNAFVVGYAEET